eukprot:Sspe_Gene.106912::Locus_84990_Transcript_1_1_Confidence_1.000_Length_1525::g.106912::m.106912/K05677/ABCD3, PMP70; ATP-binding cassette, subfamily D (ALD), member 3
MEPRRGAVGGAVACMAAAMWLSMQKKKTQKDDSNCTFRPRLATSLADCHRKVGYHVFSRLFKLLRICIPKGRRKEPGYLLALTILLCVRVALSATLARIGGSAVTHFVSRRWSALKRSLSLFIILGIPSAIVNSFLKFFQSRLAIAMRVNLSTFINKEYLSGNNFYKAASLKHISDLDKLVTDDVQHFCDDVAMLYSHTIKPLLDVTLYTYYVGKLVGWQGPTIMWVYFYLRYHVQRRCEPLFNRLVVGESVSPYPASERQYRVLHAEIKDHAEQIAFCAGGKREFDLAMEKIQALSEQSTTISMKSSLVTFLDSMLSKYVATFMGYVVILSPYYLGLSRVAHKTSTVMVRDYILCTQHLTELNRGSGELTASLSRLSGIALSTVRITDLLEHIREATQPASFRVRDEGGIEDNELPSRTKEWIAHWKAVCDGNAVQHAKRAAQEVLRRGIPPPWWKGEVVQ